MADQFSILDYKEYLERSGRGPSARTYYFTLIGFERWLNRRKKKDIGIFTTTDFEEYLSTVRNPNTANLTRAAVKGYLKFRAGSYPIGAPDVAIELQRSAQVDLIRPRRVKRRFQKEALTPDEVRSVLGSIADSGLPGLVHSLAVLSAYFGWRPIEGELYLTQSKINWRENSVVIRTAKTGNERFLCWDDNITPFIEDVTSARSIAYPGQYLTKQLYKYQNIQKHTLIKGITLTAKTFRKTFQTNERLMGINDMFIDYILGHESRGSRIGDVYTDFTQFEDRIRQIMTSNEHYMIANSII
jgi:integrase